MTDKKDNELKNLPYVKVRTSNGDEVLVDRKWLEEITKETEEALNDPTWLSMEEVMEELGWNLDEDDEKNKTLN